MHLNCHFTSQSGFTAPFFSVLCVMPAFLFLCPDGCIEMLRQFFSSFCICEEEVEEGTILLNEGYKQ